jgi:dienelactone hydrolase
MGWRWFRDRLDWASMSIMLALLLAVQTVAIPKASAAPAKPTMWVESATQERTPLGPTQASGAVIWAHGLSMHDEDSRAPTPPYIKALAEQGWDTFRLNRLREAESLSGTTARLAKAARDLRAQGYRRIGVAGQSFGAFAALAAVAEEGVADAVIATAPAAYGSFSDSFETWRANATELYRLLRQVGETPVMLVYFHGDAYDPGGRADASRIILTANGRRSRDLIIDQPADLIGHSAAASGLFARRFAGCIGRFIAGSIRTDADEQACETPWGRRPSSTPQAARVGATLAAAAPAASFDLTGSWYGFYRNGREVTLRIDSVTTEAEGERVSATYQLGAGLSPEERAESSRREGRFAKGELVFDEPALNQLRYRLRPDGALAGSWQSRDGATALDTVLRRLP